MQCDNCKKEETWLEKIGKDFICHRCLKKNKELGFLFRTNTEVFRKVMKKLKPEDFSDYLSKTKEDVEDSVDLKRYSIKI